MSETINAKSLDVYKKISGLEQLYGSNPYTPKNTLNSELPKQTKKMTYENRLLQLPTYRNRNILKKQREMDSKMMEPLINSALSAAQDTLIEISKIKEISNMTSDTKLEAVNKGKENANIVAKYLTDIRKPLQDILTRTIDSKQIALNMSSQDKELLKMFRAEYLRRKHEVEKIRTLMFEIDVTIKSISTAIDAMNNLLNNNMNLNQYGRNPIKIALDTIGGIIKKINRIKIEVNHIFSEKIYNSVDYEYEYDGGRRKRTRHTRTHRRRTHRKRTHRK
jgi:hypothetical protein|uniref:Uncharacterized protein n=1 Tax=viral metagenome TaxID=1070528 RepID=A0A6C0BGB7_9ZZZZ